MPIANCIVSAECVTPEKDPTKVWSKLSGIPSDDMTINTVTSDHQYGKHHKVMATLYLPSAWPDSGISALQKGLAKALETVFKQPQEEVHVVTVMVDSGLVVENGQIQTWRFK